MQSMKAQLLSNESIEFALGKALLDEEFRKLLFANPEEALSGFNLTATEKNRLKQVDFETLEFLAQTLNRLNPPVENPDPRKGKNHD